jgi:surface protein
MKPILEYLSTKVVQSKIKATDDTIKNIVKDEIDRLGLDADLNHIDVSEVTNMNSLFSFAAYDNFDSPKYKGLNPDITLWDVSNVTIMNYMFYCCEKFNRDISGWDVKNVKYKDFIFYGCGINEEYKPKFKYI